MERDLSIGLQALLLLSDSDWQTIIEFLQDSDRASLRQSCKLACAAVAASVDILRLSGPQLEHLARLRLHDKFPYLRILNLYDEDGDSLSPAELAAFAAMTLPRLQLLETLRMDGLGYLPSTALVAMLRNATQLKCLDTTDGLTNEHAQELGNLTNLTHLCVGGDGDASAGLDHTGLACISKLNDLQSLVLETKAAGDELVPHLSTLAKLMSLDLHYSSITGTTLSALSCLKKLRSLDLAECDDLVAEAVPSIAQLTSLHKLLLASMATAPSGQQLAQLSSLSQLTELNLGGAGITDAAAAILDLPDLRTLTVGSIRLTSARVNRASALQQLVLYAGLEGAEKLFPLPSLKLLTVLSGSSAGTAEQAAREAAAIAGATGLTCLQLHSSHWRDQHYKAALRVLTCLEHLELSKAPHLALQGVQAISGLPDLQSLSVRYSGVEGWQLALLQRCKALTALAFRECGEVCTASLAQLLCMPRIKRLTVGTCAGVCGIRLQQLARMCEVSLILYQVQRGCAGNRCAALLCCGGCGARLALGMQSDHATTGSSSMSVQGESGKGVGVGDLTGGACAGQVILLTY